MNFITEIINDLKKWCCPFLYPQEQHQQNNTLNQHLFELQPIQQKIKPSSKSSHSRKRTASYNEVVSLDDYQRSDPKQMQVTSLNMIQSSGPSKSNKRSYFFDPFLNNNSSEHSLQKQKPLILKRVESGNLRSSERKSSSQSSFQTIKSSASRPISRRNFKILRHSSSFYAKHRSNQDEFFSVNHSQDSSINQGQGNKMVTFKFSQFNENNRDGIDMMNVWIKKEYEPYPSKLYKPKLSEITKMKLQTKDFFDTMVHRLEDYYTFYFDDQHFQQPQNLTRSMSKHYLTNESQQFFTYEEKNHQMFCSINKSDMAKSFDYEKACKFMTLIVIPHCSLTPFAFLQWLNKLQVQSSLHCFNKIEYIENSEIVDDKITLQYPLVRAEQFNEKLLGKQTFNLARQIEVVKFQNDQDRETLLQICFQAIDQQKCFQRLVRVTAQQNEGSRVQIYIESSENIVKRQASELLGANKKADNQQNFEFTYFEQRWKKFEQRLNKNQVINKKIVQVFTN